MDFDVWSLIAGFTLAGFLAYSFYWSERGSLANRLAYLLSEQALDIIKNVGQPFEENFPYENDKLHIKYLKSLNENSGVHITQNFGVYSKEYDFWLVVEFSHDTFGDLPSRVSRYACTPGTWNKLCLIANPLFFDINKHLAWKKNSRSLSRDPS